MEKRAKVQLEADLALASSTFERFLGPNSAVDTTLLHQPAFALKHYTHQRPQDAAAAHLYALICERLGRIAEAEVSLERATALLEEEFESTESSEIEQRYSMALCNLGRVRLASKQYERSLEAYTSCWELEPATAQLKVQCKLGQGLALYRLGRQDESLEALQAGLDEAENSEIKTLKEEVAVLISRMLWGSGGKKRESLRSHCYLTGGFLFGV